MNCNLSSLHSRWKKIFRVLIVILILQPNLDAQKMDSTFFNKMISLNYLSDSMGFFADQLLTYEGSDSLYKKACLTVSISLLRSKAYEKQISFTNTLLNRNSFKNDKVFCSKSFMCLGSSHFRLKQDSLSFLSISKAIGAFRELKDSLNLLKTYCNIAGMHAARGNNRAALDTLLSVEPIYNSKSEILNDAKYAYLNSLRYVYSGLNNPKASLKFAQKALKFCEPESSNWFDIMHKIAITFNNEINKDSARYYLDQMMASDKLEDIPRAYVKAQEFNITMLINAQQDLKAEKALSDLIAYCKEKNYKLNKHEINQNRAMINVRKSNFLKAKHYYQKAIDHFSETSTSDIDYHNSLMTGYLEAKFAQENDTIADQYLKTINKNHKLLQKDIVENELQDFRVQFDTKEKERENEFLFSQKMLLEKNNALQKLLLLVAALLVGVVGFMGFRLFNRNRKQKQLNTELTSQRDQIKILNRELNHRVKNNLAFMTSLLEMQGRRTENSETKQILRESESRLKALSIVHDNLFQNDTQTTINLKTYLNEISTHLQNIFEIPGKSLLVETELLDIDFDAEDAMRVGLVVNELVTNSVKHAFTDVDNPKIILETTQSADGRIVLRYNDNGPGFVEKDLRSTGVVSESIGVKLIELLEKQLVEKLDLQMG